MLGTLNQRLAPLEKALQENRKRVSIALLFLAYASILAILAPSLQKPLGGTAYWLLFVILSLPPLYRITEIRLIALLLPFRKELGIMMGMFALMHFALFLEIYWDFIPSYLQVPPAWILPGASALLLTLVLLATSNVWSMKTFGKWWKRIHKLVYLIAFFAVVHILALAPSRTEYLVPTAIYLALKIADIVRQRIHARNP